jgi:hypothetical protein
VDSVHLEYDAAILDNQIATFRDKVMVLFSVSISLCERHIND